MGHGPLYTLACSYKFPFPETRKIRKATQLGTQNAPVRVPEKHDEEQASRRTRRRRRSSSKEEED